MSRWKTHYRICLIFILTAVLSAVLPLPADQRPEIEHWRFPGLTASPVAAEDLSQPLWPHEKSDLSPDPVLVFGRLVNGFRFVLMENREPKDRPGSEDLTALRFHTLSTDLLARLKEWPALWGSDFLVRFGR